MKTAPTTVISATPRRLVTLPAPPFAIPCTPSQWVFKSCRKEAA